MVTERFLGYEVDTIIEIGEIETKGNPEKSEFPCASGGTLRYVYEPLETVWNRKGLRVKKVWGHRCSDEDCSVTLLVPEVSDIIHKHIDEALGRTLEKSSQ